MKIVYTITILSILMLSAYADWDWEKFHDNACETNDDCKR